MFALPVEPPDVFSPKQKGSIASVSSTNSSNTSDYHAHLTDFKSLGAASKVSTELDSCVNVQRDISVYEN